MILNVPDRAYYLLNHHKVLAKYSDERIAFLRGVSDDSNIETGGKVSKPPINDPIAFNTKNCDHCHDTFTTDGIYCSLYCEIEQRKARRQFKGKTWILVNEFG